MVGDMKKHLIIISLIVIVVGIFVLYFANSSSEDISNTDISTTSVTDSDGTTHYYEPVTDNKGSVSMTAENKGVFSEIETQSNGKAVTKKNGTYITNEHTTVLPIENITDSASSITKATTKNSLSDSTKSNNADNTVEIKTTEIAKETKPTATSITAENTTNKNETTTQKSTQPATDKDGWITKWY